MLTDRATIIIGLRLGGFKVCLANSADAGEQAVTEAAKAAFYYREAVKYRTLTSAQGDSLTESWAQNHEGLSVIRFGQHDSVYHDLPSAKNQISGQREG